jgi:hypothetical protein
MSMIAKPFSSLSFHLAPADWLDEQEVFFQLPAPF